MSEVEAAIQAWMDGLTNEVPEDRMALARVIAGFAREHQVIPDIRPIGLFGFGQGLQFFRNPAGGWWMPLDDLEDPTGVPLSRLRELFAEDREEFGGHDCAYMVLDSGFEMEMVAHSFAMRVFSGESPWSDVFYENTKDLMAHAMEKSGLMDSFAGRSEFTVVAHMKATDGAVVKVMMPVHGFDSDDVPLVRAPWDEADPDEVVRVTEVAKVYDLHRSGDAVRDFLGPEVPEDEAARRAMRGPVLPGEAS